MERDQRELSMDEILASIRSILQESSGDAPLAEHLEEEEIFDLSPEMMVEEPYSEEDVEQVVRELEADAGISDDIADELGLDEYEPAPAVFVRKETDIADGMIESFAQLFNERKASYSPSSNTDKLVEEIVREAIETKMVPVLDEWLERNLTKLIRQEVRRVVVKDGE